jgi:hypothetical protein
MIGRFSFDGRGWLPVSAMLPGLALLSALAMHNSPGRAQKALFFGAFRHRVDEKVSEIRVFCTLNRKMGILVGSLQLASVLVDRYTKVA